MVRVAILHGLNADPTAHWFPWLAESLTAEGIATTIVALPDSSMPDRDRWVAAAREAFGELDDELVVVTHSLGSPTALHALGGASIRGLVLVSPMWERLEHIPALDAFVTDVPHPATLVGSTPVTVVVSDDDEVVPPDASRRVAEQLDARLVTVPGGGHFLARQGWTELPAALDAVLALR